MRLLKVDILKSVPTDKINEKTSLIATSTEKVQRVSLFHSWDYSKNKTKQNKNKKTFIGFLFILQKWENELKTQHLCL